MGTVPDRLLQDSPRANTPPAAGQVLNQTSRMEIQLLETSVSTNKLEQQLLLQGHELHRLQGRNRWALAVGAGLGQELGQSKGPGLELKNS